MSYPFEGRAQKWEDYRNLRTNQLNENFWTKVTKEVRSNPGSIDSTNRAINFPTFALESSDALWDKYSKAAVSKGLKPNYTQFLENYKLVKDYDNNKIAKLINSASVLGIKDRDIKKSLKGNKDAIAKLQKIMLNADPETQELLAPYLSKDKTLTDYWKNVGEDIMEMPGENPLLTTILGAGLGVGGATLGYKGAKGAYNYMRPGSATPKDEPKSPRVYVKKAQIDEAYRKYQQDYKGDRSERLNKKQFAKDYRAELKSKVTSKVPDSKGWKVKGKSMVKGLGKQLNPIKFVQKNPAIAIMMAAQYLMSDSDKE